MKKLAKTKKVLADQGIDLDTELSRMEEFSVDLERCLFAFTDKYKSDPSPLVGGTAIAAISSFVSRVLAAAAFQMHITPKDVLKNFSNVLSKTVIDDYKNLLERTDEKNQA